MAEVTYEGELAIFDLPDRTHPGRKVRFELDRHNDLLDVIVMGTNRCHFSGRPEAFYEFVAMLTEGMKVLQELPIPEVTDEPQGEPESPG